MTASSVSRPREKTVGLIGCGRWGRHILRDLRELGCGVVVADTDEAAQNRALEKGATATVSTFDELPDDLDGYVVATPSITHGAISGALLPRRRPIFTEKPMTTNAAEAADLAARGQGLQKKPSAGERLRLEPRPPPAMAA